MVPGIFLFRISVIALISSELVGVATNQLVMVVINSLPLPCAIRIVTISSLSGMQQGC